MASAGILSEEIPSAGTYLLKSAASGGRCNTNTPLKECKEGKEGVSKRFVLLSERGVDNRNTAAFGFGFIASI